MQNRPPSLAEYYHQETKYSEEQFRSAPPRDLDFTKQPHPFKEYLSERAISLVPHLPFRSFPLTGEVIDPRAASAEDPLLPSLSRLLYFTNGVTAIVRGSEGQGVLLFRAAPSAGALYPTEIYVVTEGVAGVPNGLHNYSVRKHELVPVFDGELKDELSVCCFGHPAIPHARAVAILTGVYERSVWRYQDRAYRRILLDTGHVAGNLQLVAEAEGLIAQQVGSFADETINQLLFFDSRSEAVLLVVPLIEDSRMSSQDLSEATLRSGPARRSSEALAAPTGDEELLVALHRGSSIELEELDTVTLGPRAPEAEPCELVPLSGRLEDLRAVVRTSTLPPSGRDQEARAGLHETIMQRRSTRVFSGDLISLEQLGQILDFGYRSYPGPDDVTAGAALQSPHELNTHVIVFGVAGLAQGVYRYRAEPHDLVLVREGDFLGEARRFCLHQQVSLGGAAMVVHTANLPDAVRTYGNRAYRHLHLDAGFIGECLNLAAIRLGLGASGIGGFLDDEVNELIGLPASHAVVYLTVLGAPEEIA